LRYFAFFASGDVRRTDRNALVQFCFFRARKKKNGLKN
jgi:hypothetical protein